MNDNFRLSEPAVRIDVNRLRNFFVRLFAGIGILTVWTIFLGISVAAFIYLFTWLSNFPSFTSFVYFLFVPVVLISWWLCFYLSIEFLAEIGIELNGLARYAVIPIAIPLAVTSFVLGFSASIGESLKSKAIIAASFALGLILTAASIALFLYPLK